MLNSELVWSGKMQEHDFFDSKHVLDVGPREQARGKNIIGTRWVVCNKGDEANPDVRCRLVAQEVKTHESQEFYAATPPIEALRLVVSSAAELEE